jgi:uncharacterized protein involved in outer membrane biogenesis
VKRILFILLLVIGVAAGALLAAYAYLSAQDAEQMRRLVESSLESALGRDVSISGPFEVTLVPLPAIAISDVTIGNAPWGSRPEMLFVEELRLRPRLRRLLVGQIELSDVTIRGARVFLENGPDGRGNWQFQPRADQESTDLPIHIRAITMNDLHAAYVNPAAGLTREITLDRLRLFGRPSTDVISVDIQGQVLDQDLRMRGHIGRFRALMDGRPFPVDLEASIGETSLSLTGKIDDPDFRDYEGIRLRLQASGHRPVVLMGWTNLDIPPLDSFEIAGELVGSGGRLEVNQFQSRFRAKGYNLALSGSVGHLPLLQELSLDFDGSSDRITEILPWTDSEFTLQGQFSVKGHLAGDLDDPRLDTISLSADVLGASLQLDGSLRDLPEGGQVDALVSFQGTGLAAVGDRLHIPMPDLDALDLIARLSGTLVAPALTEIQATLTEGSLRAEVTGTAPSVTPVRDLQLGFELSGDDFSDLASIFGVEGLPRTDGTTAKGVIRGGADDLRIILDDLKLARRDRTELRASGSIDPLGDHSKMDLAIRLTGVNVNDLGLTEGVPLPTTDSFSVNGRLTGPVSDPDLEEVDARARLANIAVTLKGRFPNILDFQQMDAHVTAEGDDLSILGHELGQAWPRSRSFDFSGRTAGEIQAPRVEDLAGRLKSDDVDLSISGRIEDVLQGDGFDLHVLAKAASLTSFLPFGGFLWDALGETTADFSLRGDPDRFDVALDDMSAGRTSLRGAFTYTHSEGARARRIEGSFQESVLDLTPWLDAEGRPQEMTGATPSGPAPPKFIFAETPLPVAWMQDLTLAVDLGAIDLVFGESRIQLVRGEMNLSEESLSVSPAQLEYQGAVIDGGFTLRGGDMPSLDLQSLTRGLDLGDLARRARLSEDAKGLLDMRLNIKSTGRSAREMAASAQGRLTVLMTQGFIGDQTLPLHFGQVLFHLMPWVKDDKGISIDCGMLDLPVSDGVANLRFFVLDTQDMLMRGTGTIDLGRESYDLLFVPRAKRKRALAHKVDVRIGGTLRNPEIRYDAAAAGLGALEAAGRFAILGPAGLFISSDTFRRQRQTCAQSLEGLDELQ